MKVYQLTQYPMKMLTICNLLCLCMALVPLQAHPAELPTGQATPEGVACDAIVAHARSDSKEWLATLVRHYHGKDTGDGKDTGEKYELFKKAMVKVIDDSKADKSSKPMRILKCFKARKITNGFASFAMLTTEFTDNMFVDLVIEGGPPGQTPKVRYHVVRDKDNKWYFDPMPDCGTSSIALTVDMNEEAESTVVVYERKGAAPGEQLPAFPPSTKIREPDYNTMGMLALTSGDTARAIECFEEALKRDPDNITIYSNLGSAYSKKGDFAKTIEILNKAILKDPDFSVAYVNLATAYTRSGDYDKARTNFHEAGVRLLNQPDNSNLVEAYAIRNLKELLDLEGKAGSSGQKTQDLIDNLERKLKAAKAK